MAGTPHEDALLDVLAAIEARLRGDDAAFSHLLDAGSNRDQAAMACDVAAHLMRVLADDPLALLARLRPVLMAAEPPARPPGRAVGD
jgi:hypothetical protein